jgi:hypothetical protein
MKARRSCRNVLKMNIKNTQSDTSDFTYPVPLAGSRPGSCCTRATLAQRELTWVDLINRYPSPRECLAAFVVSSAAEVIAGVKPANLIRIIKRTLPCGRCMYQLWRTYGAEVLRGSALQVLTLRSDADGISLLFYCPELLTKRLSSRTMHSFLTRCGYPQPLTLDSALVHLQKVCQEQESPDEIGMFLGYPAKDVRGFIAGKSSPWQGRCLWRVYGPPLRSLRLYQRFCAERQAINRRMMAGMTGDGPAALLLAS